MVRAAPSYLNWMGRLNTLSVACVRQRYAANKTNSNVDERRLAPLARAVSRRT